MRMGGAHTPRTRTLLHLQDETLRQLQSLGRHLCIPMAPALLLVLHELPILRDRRERQHKEVLQMQRTTQIGTHDQRERLGLRLGSVCERQEIISHGLIATSSVNLALLQLNLRTSLVSAETTLRRRPRRVDSIQTQQEEEIGSHKHRVIPRTVQCRPFPQPANHSRHLSHLARPSQYRLLHLHVQMQNLQTCSARQAERKTSHLRRELVYERHTHRTVERGHIPPTTSR